MRLLVIALAVVASAAPRSAVPAGLRFEPNVGQTDRRAQFVARSSRYNTFLTTTGAVVAPRNSVEGVRIRFVDSRPAKLEGASPLPGVVNYFRGSAPGLGNVPTYQRVAQRNLYPGVDAIFHGEEGHLEYDFIIAPGADPSRIVLAFDGARRVQLNHRGEIELATAAGTLTQRKPVIYQEREGRRIPVDGHYAPFGDREFALVVGKYDRARPLIIDPTLVFFTSIGGSGPDQVNGLALDSQGNIYIAGQTGSLGFPVVGGVQAQLSVAYAYRLDNSANTPTRLTGILSSITSIATDPKSPSTVYAGTRSGLLKSTDSGATWNTIGAGLPAAGTISSIVIDPSNSQVIYLAIENGPGLFKSTDAGLTWTAINNGLTGANATDIQISESAIVIDPLQTSHILVGTGHGEFQTTDGGANWSPYSFQYDVIAFDPNNQGVIYATSLVGVSASLFKSTDGGITWNAISPLAGNSPVFALLVDPFNSSTLYAGAASGLFKSTDRGLTWKLLNFPSSFAVYQLTADPVQQNTLYVQPYGNLYKTTDGGTTFSQVTAGFSIQTLAVSSNSAIYLATTAANNVFVTKLDPTGKTILYSTYIGGGTSDQTAGIAIDGQDNVYVTGITSSPDFPVTSGALGAGGRPGSAVSAGFVFKLNPNGNKLIYSATIDGVTPAAIAIDPEGSAYVTGTTTGGLAATKGAYWTTAPPCIATGFIGCIAQADEFVFKLNPTGSALAYATYLNQLFLAGSAGQIGQAIALDSSGNAYVTGLSRYVDKLSADGSSLLYATVLNTVGGAIALDSVNNAYVTGPGALVAKFDPNGAQLFSKTVGDVNYDSGVAIALDSAGDIVIAGQTYSPYFPLFSPTQGMFASVTGFLTKLDSSAANLLFSTYVGDSRAFLLCGLVLDSSGRAIISGSTFSGAISQQSLYQDAFVSEYDMSGIPTVRLDNLLNAASRQGSPVSVGEIVTVEGAGFGTAANTQLLFDQMPATVFSATPNRLSVMVPFALDGKTFTQVEVQSAGVLSNPVWIVVAPTSPGIYTADGSGSGQALAFNQDGTPNSLSNPAAVGSTITFYATGVGQTIPPGVDGVLHRGGPAAPVNSVAIYIGYSYISGPQFHVGPAPGFPGDVFIVQAVVPSPNMISLPSLVPVQISVGGVSSQEQPFLGSSSVEIAIKQN